MSTSGLRVTGTGISKPTMLTKIADFYEEEVDAAVGDLMTAMEPAMIVVLGVVVGGIVISMYLPIFTLVGKLSSK